MGSDHSVMAKPALDIHTQSWTEQDACEETLPLAQAEDSFVSCDSATHIHTDGHLGVPQTSVQEMELCNLVNFINLQASFLSSVLSNLDSVNHSDHLNPLSESCNYQGSVAACAAFIISCLKNYGKLNPTEISVQNNKTTSMINVLEELEVTISQFKTQHWEHQSDSHSTSKKCEDCNAREIIFNQIKLLNLSAECSFCHVCLTTIPVGDVSFHINSEFHVKLKDKLTSEIYPILCSICGIRFVKECDLEQHCLSHDHENLVDRIATQYFCCYLCKTAFKDASNLRIHKSKSLEHACRKELACELSSRLQMVSDSGTENACVTSVINSCVQVAPVKHVSIDNIDEVNFNNNVFSGSAAVDAISWFGSSNLWNDGYVETDTVFSDKRSINEIDFEDGETSQFEKSINVQEVCSNLRSDIGCVEHATLSSNVISQQLLEPPKSNSESSFVHLNIKSDEEKWSTSITSSASYATGSIESKAVECYETPEFEAECGTCGRLFRIYNNDLKLSLDIHVQSDALHVLAITTPKSSNTEDLVKPVNASMIEPSKKVDKQDTLAVVSSINDSQSSVKSDPIPSFLEMEFNCLKKKNNTFLCGICNVKVPNSEFNKITHVFGRTHVHASHYEDSIDTAKIKLGYLYLIEGHIIRTSFLCPSSKKGFSDSQVIQLLKTINNFREEILSKCPDIQCYFYYCFLCRVPLSSSNKSVHENGRKHQMKLFSNIEVEEESTQDEVAVNRQIYCEVCDVRLASLKNKEEHDAGWNHRQNLSRRSKKKQTRSKCDVCNITMNIKDMDSHLRGKKHLKLAVRE